MKCRVCEQEMHERGGNDADHHRHVWPLDPHLCAGCGKFMLEMQLFLIRSADRTVMGDWETGWMKAILEQPAKYRDS